ncbi:Spo0B domain-containing protein [Desmospora activa]|uniref:Sensor kinase SpoOB-type protein n=1 Tax=Desmospora activa DSM 45169 TaxID=1121389 RepID=A0A2T4Z8R5_9BACL|nr:Spo0B domain-containing protein [Desmospora activa]PTM58282.1 sensor kinase SpoOB-type protein [Desmospora activa DSM 45169]
MGKWLYALPIAGWLVVMAVQPWGRNAGLIMALIGWLLLIWCWHRYHVIGQAEKEKQIDRFLRLWSNQRHDWLNHIQVISAYASLEQTEKITAHLQILTSELATEREGAVVKDPSLALFLSTLRMEWIEWKTEVTVSSEVATLGGPAARLVENTLRHMMDWITALAPADGEPGELWIQLEQEGNKGILIRLEGEPETWPTLTESDWSRLRNTITLKKAQLQPQAHGVTVYLPLR